jgi:hypothetical protein
MTMTFSGRGTPITATDFNACAAILGGDPASLWALLATEAFGCGFLADRRPRILFERDVFHRRTGGRFSHTHPDISASGAGGYAGGTAEYDRLARAIALDQHAALESTSWGLGLVMGYNAHSVGFATVEAMVSATTAGEGVQLRAAANLIAANAALLTAFRACQWESVALHYNGPAGTENHYAGKLARCYETFSNPASRPNIATRTAQVCLLYLGYSVGEIDGLDGPATRAAVLAFRHASGLPAGGLDVDVLGRLRTDASI